MKTHRLQPSNDPKVDAPHELLTTHQAAECLRLTERCLEAWRFRRTGPPWCAISRRRIRYRRSDLLAFIEANMRRPEVGDAA
jgi:Helix-turn-helix domain